MKWYYDTRGGHTHVRVFLNGALCGWLVFRNEEFVNIRNQAFVLQLPTEFIEFKDDNKKEQ